MLAALLTNLPEPVAPLPNIEPGAPGHFVDGRTVGTLNLNYGDLPTDKDWDEELCLLLMRSKL